MDTIGSEVTRKSMDTDIRSQKELYIMPKTCRREKFWAVERTELSLWVVPNSLSKGHLPYEMSSATA